MQQVLPCPAPEGTRAAWGLLAAIDLHGADPARLEDPEVMRSGEGDLEGWSAMQVIETSSVTVRVPSCCGSDPAAGAELER